MKNKLTDNLVLKIGSVLFAAVLWLLVTNISDPPISQKFYNVPVEILNADMITSQGKLYEVLDDSAVIDTVTVVAPRSIIDSIGQENIIATADMNDLTNLNTIQIKLTTNKYSDRLDNIGGSIETVKLNIEDKETVFLALKAATSGNVENGYMIGDVTTEQNVVQVTGPASVIARISSAEVIVGVTGFTSDIGTDAEIKLYDADGVEISKYNLSLNINSVRVKVEILATKELPLVFAYTGNPAAGYRASGVAESTPASVTVAGKSSVLKNLSEISIPDTALDITGLTENLKTAIDVREYLPGNIELADKDFDGNVMVTVYIEPEIARNVVISEEDITIQNMPEGFAGSVTAEEDEFTIQIRGLAADVNGINAEEVAGVVDVAQLLEEGEIEELAEGSYYVSLSLNLPDTVQLKEKVTVKLNIRAMQNT